MGKTARNAWIADIQKPWWRLWTPCLPCPSAAAAARSKLISRACHSRLRRSQAPSLGSSLSYLCVLVFVYHDVYHDAYHEISWDIMWYHVSWYHMIYRDITVCGLGAWAVVGGDDIIWYHAISCRVGGVEFEVRIWRYIIIYHHISCVDIMSIYHQKRDMISTWYDTQQNKRWYIDISCVDEKHDISWYWRWYTMIYHDSNMICNDI